MSVKIRNREMQTWACADCGTMVLATLQRCHMCGCEEADFSYAHDSRVSPVTGMARNPFRHHTDDD
jgi:hypothetical protein